MVRDTLRQTLRAELDGLPTMLLRQRLAFERCQTGHIISDAVDGSIGAAEATAQLDSNALDLARIRAALRRRGLAA